MNPMTEGTKGASYLVCGKSALASIVEGYTANLEEPISYNDWEEAQTSLGIVD
jgi:hypothetical protein